MATYLSFLRLHFFDWHILKSSFKILLTHCNVQVLSASVLCHILIHPSFKWWWRRWALVFDIPEWRISLLPTRNHCLNIRVTSTVVGHWSLNLHWVPFSSFQIRLLKHLSLSLRQHHLSFKLLATEKLMLSASNFLVLLRRSLLLL